MKSEVIDIKELPIKYFSKIFNDEIMIYKVNKEFFAISTFCPHFGGPLEIKEGKINCYWHDWDFDSKSHFCTNRQVKISLFSYGIEELPNNQALLTDAN